MLWSEKVFSAVNDRQLGSTWVLTGAMAVGLLLILLFGFKAPETAKGWAMLLTLGFVGTLIPIFAMNVGIQMIGSARSSVISTLQPVVTVLISMIFLQEMLSVPQWIGGVMVIVAILLLQRSSDVDLTLQD
jgi:drug/metabolite transporter (DMT)-like permease